MLYIIPRWDNKTGQPLLALYYDTEDIGYRLGCNTYTGHGAMVSAYYYKDTTPAKVGDGAYEYAKRYAKDLERGSYHIQRRLPDGWEA